MPDKGVLRQYQALPLIAKVRMSQQRIREWYDHWDGDVCISFSGGKDSTVLAHLVHEYYPKVPLVFADTGLEYPEIRQFARKMGAEFTRPKMRFDEVISKYGYPIISKENAEAIYYARRIRNSVGGWYRKTSDQKRAELNGQPRPDGNSTGHADGTKCYTGSAITLGGGITDTHRKRSNLMNLRRQYEQVRQTGLVGEETPLPG